MIEWNLLPAALDVAGFALRPELAFMLVILLVARDAVSLQFVLVQISLVAADTFRFFVLSEKRIFGLLVVVKKNFFPARFVMTSFTLGTKASLVLVVLLVAFVAKLRSILVFIVHMASLAFHILVLAKQFEMRFAVVEMGRLPVFFYVTVLTLRPQSTFMLVRLFMAANTLGRRLTVFLLR